MSRLVMGAAVALVLAACGPDDPPRQAEPSVHYRSCAEAQDAGDFPLKRGEDPGYRRALDGDGDGTACEVTP